MKRVKVGIIGQGRSGRDIHRLVMETYPRVQERFEVVAVADPIPERTAPSNPGASLNCKRYSDYRELLKDKNVEFVVVACRTHKHVDIAIEALEAGYNVMSEKPLTNRVSEMDRVLAVQKKTGKFFAVYQQARFRPLYRKICEIIASGVLGDIAMVKASYNGFGRRWDWQTIQDMSGGELMNTGSHPIDQLIGLWDMFGESYPDRIFAKLACINNFGDAEDFAKVILEGKDHPLIDLEISRECLFPGQMYQVYGSNGSLTAHDRTIDWKYYIPEDAPKQEVLLAPLETAARLPKYGSEKLEFYSGHCEFPETQLNSDEWSAKYYLNLYDALVNGAPLEVKLTQVRRQIAILEECYRQNPMPKFVKVPAGTI